MAESATKPEGVRERRRERTRLELTRQARLLTVERGLAGFTVEEVCELVGVSRRTFFNYFPSKDDAVVGHRDDTLDERALAAFIEARRSAAPGISPTLVRDLVDLAIASIPFDEHSDDQPSPEAVIEREPHLLPKFMREGAELERRLTEVVAAREGIDADDPRAAMAVQLVGTLVRRAALAHLAPDNTTDFASLLIESLDAARALFTTTAEGTE